MALKKLGELIREYDFESIHHELTMELKTDVQMINLCRVLYEGLKSVEYVPSRLRYAIITSEDLQGGSKSDSIVAYADFMDNTISIHDLDPGEIISTEVDLDDPELESLFIALCLFTLCQDEEEVIEEDTDFEEKVIFRLEEPLELGEKEYDEDSLFPFKKSIDKNENVS